MDVGPGGPAVYLLGELERGVAAESQHVLQLLRRGGDQRDRVLLLSLLQLPQTADERRLCGINQT